MNIDLKIHPLTQLVKSFFGHIEKRITGLKYATNELLVLNYHSTPKKFTADFESQVKFLLKNFNIITPAELDEFYSNPNWNKNKCSVLFTFDDGLKNNAYALEVLEKYNIKAFLFIVPDFIHTPEEKQKEYYIKNIRPDINPAIDSEPEDFTALTWQELKAFVNKGHLIGSHTQTHSLVASQSDHKNSEAEIVTSKKTINEKLHLNIDSFCSINNTAWSIGKKEKALIAENYKFHFTTFPGLNRKNSDPLFIKRRNVECFWPMGAIYYASGKMDLKRWESKIQQYGTL